MKKLVLATKSKRRIELLRAIGADFIVVEPRGVVEVYDGDPREVVLENARRKAYSVVDLVPRDSVIVAADTIIAIDDGRVIGKPPSVNEQVAILKRLRGRWHRVLTGVFIIDMSEKTVDYFVEETRVKMRYFTDKELELYAASLEGLGKAGGYAIQGLGSLLIEKIDGDYYNVVGLPLARLHVYLLKHGINILESGVMKRVVGGSRGHLFSSTL
ncbi:septum formation protein Maf [Desulfurococcaceae archaeon MEX13E-LK6-19]|nr:septum formation protein Maf [Desulfurococcaceae archaeon MEX13E-LK6-19]